LAEEQTDLAPALSLCRNEPDCVGLGCEAAIRRGVSKSATETKDRLFEPTLWSNAFVSGATTDVQHHVGAATLYDAVAHDVLRRAAEHYYFERTAMHESGPPVVGEASMAALLVANNLGSHFRAGARCPSVRGASPDYPGALSGATVPSINHLDRLIKSRQERAALSSGDLAVIHLLVKGLAKALSREQSPSTQTGVEPRGCLGFFRSRQVQPRTVAVAPQAFRPDPREHRDLCGEFAAGDLLGCAGTLFAGTAADDVNIAAEVLRGLAASSDGVLAISLITRDAARSLDKEMAAMRVAQIGLALLSGEGVRDGAWIAARLLAEVMCVFPHSGGPPESMIPETQETEFTATGCRLHRGEGGALWRILCGSPTEPEKALFPRFVARVLQMAMALSEERRKWTERDGEFLARARDAAEALLGGPMLADPHWHLFYVRTVDSLAQHPLADFHLPNCGQWSARELCARLEQVFAAYEEVGSDPLRKQIRAEAQAVIETPGFERAFRDGGRQRRAHWMGQTNKRDFLDDYLSSWAAPQEDPHSIVQHATQAFFEKNGTSWNHALWLEFLRGVRTTVSEKQLSNDQVGLILEQEALVERQRRERTSRCDGKKSEQPESETPQHSFVPTKRIELTSTPRKRPPQRPK